MAKLTGAEAESWAGGNPWVSGDEAVEVEPLVERSPAPAVWGRDPGIRPVGPGTIGVAAAVWRPGIHVVAAHGGAGASTLAALTGCVDAGRRWPCSASRANAVVVCARTNALGLEAARDAAMRFYSGRVRGVEVVGVVLVADAPGRRLPRALAEAADAVAGAYPRCWRLPWVEGLRQSGRWPSKLPASVARVADEIVGLDGVRERERNAHVE